MNKSYLLNTDLIVINQSKVPLVIELWIWMRLIYSHLIFISINQHYFMGQSLLFFESFIWFFGSIIMIIWVNNYYMDQSLWLNEEGSIYHHAG